MFTFRAWLSQAAPTNFALLARSPSVGALFCAIAVSIPARVIRFLPHSVYSVYVCAFCVLSGAHCESLWQDVFFICSHVVSDSMHLWLQRSAVQDSSCYSFPRPIPIPSLLHGVLLVWRSHVERAYVGEG